MLRDLFLAAGLLALLALATATIPSHILLRNSWRFRVAVGLTAGLAAGANMALPALQQVMVPFNAPPLSTAIAMLIFGPVAGLTSAATVALFHLALHPSTHDALGLACMLATAGLAYGWHQVRQRSRL